MDKFTCPVCSKEFYRHKSQSNGGRPCCSTRCAPKLKTVGRTTKVCRGCSEQRSLSEFYINKKGLPQGKCKTCYRSRTYAERELSRRYTQKWRERNPHAVLESRLHVHHLTLDQYSKLLANQGGVCKVCGIDSPGFGRNWCVDHDHKCCPGVGSCGKCIRGLVCQLCNTGLGSFRDDPATLVMAAEYLIRWNTCRN